MRWRSTPSRAVQNCPHNRCVEVVAESVRRLVGLLRAEKCNEASSQYRNSIITDLCKESSS